MEFNMEDKIKFQESLKKIEAYALKKDKILEKDEIDDYFVDLNLTKEQMQMIYGYLSSRKIKVNDNEVSKTDKEELGDQKVLDIYFEEMKFFSSFQADTVKEMYFKAVKGDAYAKIYLIEHHLKLVVTIAKRYEGNGVELSDLIQEGNVALMLAMDKLENLSFDKGKELEGFQEYLKDAVTKGILDAISFEDSLQSSNEMILDKVNYINETARDLMEDLGKTLSVEDIATYLTMDLEEVKEILNLSAGELPIENTDKES